MSAIKEFDIDKPRYDQSTYWGRARYFFSTTNPLNLFNSNTTLEESKKVVLAARNGKWDEIKHLSHEEIWRAKELHDSAYHPDTGELMNIVGRMSAQVPMNMAITGCMMNFYKSNAAVIFWQWVNQSFNALVNYTNRSGDAAISVEQIGKSYCLATGGALVTALTLNKMAARFPPLVGRIVPFVAVAAANCINIPMMRMQELQNGITIVDENGNRLGESKKAAAAAISAVTFSRVAMASPGMKLGDGISVSDLEGKKLGVSKCAANHAIRDTIISRNLMAAPGMVITPVIMNKLDSKGVFLRYPWASTPLSVIICGICLTFATPMCCALFEQRASIRVSDLEKELQALEVCVDSVVSALNASNGGARRLELCSSLSLGGLTPSLGLFVVVRRSIPRDCDVFVMIRPKPGEQYVYDEHEIQVMVEDIRIFKENGADGFVFGCLKENKDVDEENCLKLLVAAQGLPCTFHRAFDVVNNPEDSLMCLIRLGFSRVLTSGQEENAYLGRHLIKKLVLKVKELGSGFIIIAGGGVSPGNLKEILMTTNVKEYHGSARAQLLSTNDKQNCIYVTDELVVRDMIKIGATLTAGSV